MIFERTQLVDSMGSMKTLSLFIEFRRHGIEPIMSLSHYEREYEGKPLVSLKKIYMEEEDLEEYKVAIRVFGSWNHWKKLLGNAKITAYIEEYREELETKIRSEAVRALVKTATLEGAKGTAAAKYVAEKGWNKRKAGAPSKNEVTRELKVQTRMDSELKEDMKRIGLRVEK